jgi:hypothetical protein
MQLTFFSELNAKTDGGLPSSSFAYRNTIRKDGAAGLLDSWNSFISMYTQLQLSVPMDVLPAIYAIAEVVGDMHQDLMSDDYKAGLWRQHMPLNLLWAHGHPKWSVDHPTVHRHGPGRQSIEESLLTLGSVDIITTALQSKSCV